MLDGIICLDNEEAITVMARAGKENRSLHVIVDERNHIKSSWDDVIYIGCPELQRVMTPRKMLSGFHPGEGSSRISSASMVVINEAEPETYVHPVREEQVHEENEEESDKDLQEESEEVEGEDNEMDDDFYESDYDVADGDDDLFEENVELLWLHIV